MLAIILLFLSISTVEAAPTSKSSIATCFKRIMHRSIDNYAPIAEYNMVSLSECMRHCLHAAGNGQQGGSICQSFTFQNRRMLCKLYDHNGHKGIELNDYAGVFTSIFLQVPAIIHPAKDIDFFRRVSDSDLCVGQTATQRENFEVLRQTFSTSGMASGSEEKSELVTSQPVSSSRISRPKDLASSSTDEFMLKTKALAAPIAKAEDNLRTTFRGQEIEPVSKARDYEKCTSSLGYYVVVGNEIVLPTSGGAHRVYNGIEQGDCAKYCSEDIGPDGVPIKCRSLNYFPLEEKCELYSILAEPHGTGSLMQNEKVIYAEKFCLPDTGAECQADEIFILHVHKTIKKSSIKVGKAESITECLAKCIEHPRCQSSVLNSEDHTCKLFDVRASAVEVTEDAAAGNVLIENGCRWKLNSSPAKPKRTENVSEWSDCSFKIDGILVKVKNTGGEVEIKAC